MTASIRRAPAPTELSPVITNGPISAVERTWVPPQSSREKPSISTTRTSLPYFSPKSIIAPSRRASSIGVRNVRTGIASKTFSLTMPLDPLALLGAERPRVAEVEAQLVGAHGRAGLLDVVAEHLAQRGVQEVGRGVVGHRREARRPGDRARAPGSAAPSAAPERLVVADLDEQHLVGAEAEHLDDRVARAARVELERAGVAHLAAAGGVEGRALELERGGGVPIRSPTATTAVSTSVVS